MTPGEDLSAGATELWLVTGAQHGPWAGSRCEWAAIARPVGSPR
jgi:hypothetical protein